MLVVELDGAPDPVAAEDRPGAAADLGLGVEERRGETGRLGEAAPPAGEEGEAERPHGLVAEPRVARREQRVETLPPARGGVGERQGVGRPVADLAVGVAEARLESREQGRHVDARLDDPHQRQGGLQARPGVGEQLGQHRHGRLQADAGLHAAVHGFLDELGQELPRHRVGGHGGDDPGRAAPGCPRRARAGW